MFGLSEARLIAFALVAFTAFMGGVFVTHGIDSGVLAREKLAHANAIIEETQKAIAVQQVYDQAALSAAQREGATQAARAALAQRQLVEVRNHVKAATGDRGCVPYGFVRVLVSGARGITADTLPLPAGKSDDTCSAYDWPTVARAIVTDYAAARANGGQLDALIGVLRDFQKARPK
jgi:hypothetical protein